ncbi:MAG TPA: beta-propeller fold lactonase family protein [Candidatus Angelobacter sp.]
MRVTKNALPLQHVRHKFDSFLASSGFLSLLLFLLVVIPSGIALAQEPDGAASADRAARGNSHEFLYAVENPGTASTIEGFRINQHSGALTPLKSAASAGNNASQIVVDQSSKFLFVGNSTGCCFGRGHPPQVLSFTISPAGTLKLASDLSVPNDNDTLSGLALDPTGRDAYSSSTIVDSAGAVSQLQVNRKSGSLSVLAPDSGSQHMPGPILVHPNGRFFYASTLTRHHHPEEGGFNLYLRDLKTGKLTNTNAWFNGGPGFPDYGDTVITRNGRFLIAVGAGFFRLDVFSINSTNGNLTLVSHLSGDFRGLVADRNGRFVVVTDGSGGVTSYAVHPDGTLTAVSALTAVANISNVVMDPGNRFVYVESTNTSQIFAYTFHDKTGSLGIITGSPFSAVGKPVRMATAAPEPQRDNDGDRD